MILRAFCVILLLLLIVPCAWADIPSPDGRRPNRNRYPLPPDDFVPKQLPRLLIVQNQDAASARLILPANASAALKAEKTQTAGFPLVGLGLTGSLIAGGLWLVRLPKAKYVLAVALPVGAVALAGLAMAQPEPARPVVETVKVRISRASVGSDYQLILPKRPAPTAGSK